MKRSGVLSLTTEAGLRLFDAALEREDAQLAAVAFNRAALSDAGELLPPIMHKLVREDRLNSPSRTSLLLDRLAGLADADRHTELLAYTKARVAEVAGLAPESIRADQPFLELGFDSLMSVELRNRLARDTRVPLAPAAMLEHPTAAGLATLLDEALAATLRREASRGTPSGPSPGGGNPLAALVAQARAAGQGATALELFELGLRMRMQEPGFATAFPAVSFAPGSEGRERLLCFPSLVPPNDTVQFARLAAELKGRFDVQATRYSGYKRGEGLYGSVSEFIEAQVDAIANAGAAPSGLVAYSSGAIVAHAVAHALEERGTPAKFLVLLDSPDLREKFLSPEQILALMWAQGEPSDAELTACYAYLRMWGDVPLPHLQTRVLFVRASEETPLVGHVTSSDTPGRWQARDTRAIATNHPGLVASHAHITAQVIQQWLEQVA
jgi:acyl carrier protein